MAPKAIETALVAALAVAAAAILSCQPDSRSDDWAGTVRDSAGILIVENPKEGLWEPGEEWTFSETLTIGADEVDPDYQFGKITSIQVGPDGLIFVMDQMAGEIRVFDQEGSFVRALGGRGEGPGEFSGSAADVFLMEGYRLAVPDLGNQRISLLSPEGEFLGSTMTSYASGFPVRWGGDGAEFVFVQRRAMGFNEDPDLEAGDPLVRIDLEGNEETLVIMPKAETVWMEGAAARFRYFASEPTWDVGPGGTILTAMTQVYRIDFLNPDGSMARILTKDSPSRPVAERDLARFVELMRDALKRMELSPSAVQRQIDNLSFGTTFPAFNRIMVGPEGTTFVQQIGDLHTMERLDLSEEMSRRLGANTWEVFDAESRYLGVITLPERFTPMAWESDAVYGRWLDGLDRSHMMKLTLVRND